MLYTGIVGAMESISVRPKDYQAKIVPTKKIFGLDISIEIYYIRIVIEKYTF
jgi:hypothetical protein